MTQKTKETLIWTIFGLTAAVSLYFIATLGLWVYEHDRAYPGVTVAGTSVAGMNEAEIKELVSGKGSVFSGREIVFMAEKPVTISAEKLGVNVDAEATAKVALSYGAENPFMIGIKKDFPIVFKVDEKTLHETVSKLVKINTTTAENPTLKKEGEVISVSGGSVGKRVNVAETVQNLYLTLGSLSTEVPVSSFTINPSFEKGEALARQAEITAATKGDLTLATGTKKFTVSPADKVSWVSLSGTLPSLAQRFGDDPLYYVFFSHNQTSGIYSTQKISDYLTALSGKINQSPVNAALTVSSGTVVVQKDSVNGVTLDVAASTQTVLEALEGKKETSDLVVTVVRPEVRGDNLAELGITGLISTGYSNFSGSPSNRIHNVRTGASKFNGVLIKPGAEFSFIKTLGPVDASTGYLPELVILEDKTVPEYGGGMCQVSSTAFRAALNAGLPILERLYHAYPVSYYRPYGVDATVYIPKPDLVFKNDTGHYILIQTHISSYNLYFDFYGTKPARTVKFAGNAEAQGAVGNVERVSPKIYDQGVRGKGSFTAAFWRFIYDETGKLILKSSWVSKYDSPDKYPH